MNRALRLILSAAIAADPSSTSRTRVTPIDFSMAPTMARILGLSSARRMSRDCKEDMRRDTVWGAAGRHAETRGDAGFSRVRPP